MTRIGFLFLSISFGVVCGALLALLHPSIDVALVVTIGLVCVVPIAVRAAKGHFDIFEPIVATNLALFVMYVARPGSMLASGPQHTFKGYDITSNFRSALVVALIATVSLQVGYALPAARRIVEGFPRAHVSWDLGLTVAYASALSVVGLLLFFVFLLQAGGPGFLFHLLAGRNAAYEALYRGSSAYFYGAPEVLWPASLMLLAAGLTMRRRGLVAVALVLTVAHGIFAGGIGSRASLLPLLISPGVYYYLHRDRRPRVLAVLLAGYLVFTVGIAYVRDTRTQGENVSRGAVLRESILHPEAEYRELIDRGVDNDMFESLATEMVVVPEKIGGTPVDFVYRNLAKPVPRLLWPTKPLSAEEQLTTTLYPTETQRNSSSSGVVGSFYQAGLLPGVLIGMLLVGLAFRIPWEYFQRNQGATGAKLVLASSLMFVPIALRGGVGETLVWVFFGFVPLLIAGRLNRNRIESGRASAVRIGHVPQGART
jgi:hypothetical protein